MAIVLNGRAITRQHIAHLSGEYSLLTGVIEDYQTALALLDVKLLSSERAIIQNNMGYAFVMQGKVLSRNEAEEVFWRTIAAYNEALKIWTVENNPLAWALTKTNVGQALCNLGKLLDKPELLYRGIGSYREG